MKEFAFYLDSEKLDAFKDASAEEKLEWLEEVNEFIETFVPLEKRRIWNKLREAEKYSSMHSVSSEYPIT